MTDLKHQENNLTEENNPSAINERNTINEKDNNEDIAKESFKNLELLNNKKINKKEAKMMDLKHQENNLTKENNPNAINERSTINEENNSVEMAKESIENSELLNNNEIANVSITPPLQEILNVDEKVVKKKKKKKNEETKDFERNTIEKRIQPIEDVHDAEGDVFTPIDNHDSLKDNDTTLINPPVNDDLDSQSQKKNVRLSGSKRSRSSYQCSYSSKKRKKNTDSVVNEENGQNQSNNSEMLMLLKSINVALSGLNEKFRNFEEFVVEKLSTNDENWKQLKNVQSMLNDDDQIDLIDFNRPPAVGYVRLDNDMIHLGQGVWIPHLSYKNAIFTASTNAMFVKNIAVSVFGDQYLKQHSVKGKICNKTKSAARPAIDPTKALAIRDIFEYYLKHNKKLVGQELLVERDMYEDHIRGKIADLLRPPRKSKVNDKECPGSQSNKVSRDVDKTTTSSTSVKPAGPNRADDITIERLSNNQLKIIGDSGTDDSESDDSSSSRNSSSDESEEGNQSGNKLEIV